MSARGRALSAVVGAATVAVVAALAAPAYAGDTFQQCVDRAVEHNGVPPTCTKVNGSWEASWPGDGSGSGAGGTIVVLVLLGIVGAIVTIAWKVSTAQRLAKDSGMDPSLATQMSLFTDDGLEATYLAANLRQREPSPAPPPATSGTVAERLTQLAALRDQGLVTQAEHDERRRAILDSL